MASVCSVVSILVSCARSPRVEFCRPRPVIKAEVFHCFITCSRQMSQGSALKSAMPGLFHIRFNSALITPLLMNTAVYNPCNWGHPRSWSLLGNQILAHEPNGSHNPSGARGIKCIAFTKSIFIHSWWSIITILRCVIPVVQYQWYRV
jgi:hypothetical protein